MENHDLLELEIALKKDNLKEAAEILKQKPDLQQIVNERLYALIVKDSIFVSEPVSKDSGKFTEIQKLLAIGAEPNYRKDMTANTMLEEAARTNDLLLAKLLLEKGADPCIGHIDIDDKEEKFTGDPSKKSFSIGSWPVQYAYERFMTDFVRHKDIFNLLSTATLQEFEKNPVEEQFTAVFRSIIEEIKQAKEAADKSGKRLMLLIGEGHENLNSYVIELMAYKVATNIYNIQSVLEEKDEAMLDHFMKHGTALTRGNSWVASISFLNQVK